MDMNDFIELPNVLTERTMPVVVLEELEAS